MAIIFFHQKGEPDVNEQPPSEAARVGIVVGSGADAFCYPDIPWKGSMRRSRQSGFLADKSRPIREFRAGSFKKKARRSELSVLITNGGGANDDDASRDVPIRSHHRTVGLRRIDG